MKVSEMIKELQEFMGEHGDMECGVYEEDFLDFPYFGNCNKPSLFYVDKDRHIHMLEDKYFELDIKYHRPVCIIN